MGRSSAAPARLEFVRCPLPFVVPFNEPTTLGPRRSRSPAGSTLDVAGSPDCLPSKLNKPEVWAQSCRHTRRFRAHRPALHFSAPHAHPRYGFTLRTGRRQRWSRCWRRYYARGPPGAVAACHCAAMLFPLPHPCCVATLTFNLPVS